MHSVARIFSHPLLKKAQVPLNDREIDMVSDKLYSTKHSKINYPFVLYYNTILNHTIINTLFNIT